MNLSKKGLIKTKTIKIKHDVQIAPIQSNWRKKNKKGKGTKIKKMEKKEAEEINREREIKNCECELLERHIKVCHMPFFSFKTVKFVQWIYFEEKFCVFLCKNLFCILSFFFAVVFLVYFTFCLFLYSYRIFVQLFICLCTLIIAVKGFQYLLFV